MNQSEEKAKQWAEFEGKIPKCLFDPLREHCDFEMLTYADSQEQAYEYVLLCLKDAKVKEELRIEDQKRLKLLVGTIYKKKGRITDSLGLLA